MAGFIVMRFKEMKGHWPFMKAKPAAVEEDSRSGSSSQQGGVVEKTSNVKEKTTTAPVA